MLHSGIIKAPAAIQFHAGIHDGTNNVGISDADHTETVSKDIA